MGDVYRKVQAGDPLQVPAATWNTLLEVAQERQASRRNQARDPQARGLAAGMVLVKNTSGADRERFDVLGIDSPLFTPSDSEEAFTDRVALKGVTPADPDHLGRFVVLAEPIKSGEVARAWAFGACVLQLDVENEDHEYADIADGQYMLATADTGTARILWKESGTGTKWAVVRLGAGGAGPALSWGKPQSTPTLADGWNSFDVDVYSEKECTNDTGRDATVKFHKSPGLLASITDTTPLGFAADSAGENIVVHWPPIPQAATATVKTKPTFPLSAGVNTVDMTLDATAEDVTAYFWESAKNVLWDEDDFDVGDGPYVVIPVWTGSAVQWWLAGAGGPGSAWFYGDDP